jgi:hypothetical protein
LSGNAEEDDPDDEETEVQKSICDLPAQVIFKRENK